MVKYSDEVYNFGRNLVEGYEFLLLPFFYLLFYQICHRSIRINNLDKHEIRIKKVFIHLKLLSGLFITYLFNSYYIGGDSNAYFNDGVVLNKLLFDDTASFVKLIWYNPGDSIWNSADLNEYVSRLRLSGAKNTWLVVKFSAFSSFFCFRSILCTGLAFSVLSTIALYKLYKKFYELYPPIKKQLAYGILFIPDVMVWGSGILKDTITLSALCFLFVALHDILWCKKFNLRNVLIVIISGYALFHIKIYILIVFIIAMIIWLVLQKLYNIKNVVLKILALPLFVAAVYYMSVAFMGQLAEAFERYSIENILATAKNSGDYLKAISTDDGSAYDIGKIEPTISSFVQTSPKAYVVTYFRPYLWESKKIIILLSAIESSMILLFFIMVLIKTRIIKFFGILINDATLLFCFSFTLIFGILVGISSLNFGSLVRYKIPGMPFFVAMLIIIYYYNKVKKPSTTSK